jgi:pimeloyl-ACP methyl ester carboxylesterase
VASADLWRRVASRLPHGQLSIVEGAGHMPWFDDSIRVAKEVRDILTD